MKDKETPLMRQYGQIKTRYPDTILLFRLGDFYETFGDDAVLTARACGITLTKRNNGSAGEIPLAGFPYHQLDSYLPKLVRAGHRVAVCEQLEDPKQARGIVRRDVVEVVTPGVVLYDKLLDNNSHTILACITGPTKASPSICGLAFADVSTGLFSAGDIPVDRIASVLESLTPAELIVNKDEKEWWQPLVDALPATPSLTRLDTWHFDAEFTRNALLRHFNTASLKGFGTDELVHGLTAAGVVLHYVGETQKTSLTQITSMNVHHADGFMILDAATRRNLEIHASMHGDGRQGSLITLLDHTCTPMGGRLLRGWLQSPLVSMEAIRRRLNVVRGFVLEPSIAEDVRTNLRGMGDIERLLTKVMMNRATSRDLVALRSGLERLPMIREALRRSATDAVARIGDAVDDHAEVTALLRRALSDEPPLQVGTGMIFRQGYHAGIDEMRSALTNGKEWISDYQEAERQSTGITSLKVAMTGVFGYYIEVTNTHKARVPEHYERRQTLANAERFTTPHLRDLEQKLLHAESHLSTMEAQAIEELRAELSVHGAAIQKTARAIATIDCLAGFADVARSHEYCEPDIHDGTELVIEDARHPVIERLLPPGERYVSNSIRLDTEQQQIQIITGPNMSGKSSYLRQAGLIVFLAHVGCYVPATSARIPLTDRIFTRVGAQDNILAGESTFLVEMQESANILNNATARSLILLDEVGRGTATFDGISIAWAIAEYLHEVTGAKTLFATHYHELTALADQFPRIHNHQVEVREVGDSIVFTHRVIPGHSDHSFGIHVARMAGLPPAVIGTARAVLDQLEQGHHGPVDGGRAAAVERIRLEEAGQLSMFEVRDDALRRKVQELDLDNMTPMQALKALSDLKGSLDG